MPDQNQPETENDQQVLAKVLHAERTESNSLHVDCWACEAARSKAIADLIDALRRAQTALGATEAVLNRAVPDEDAQLALWRDYWRDLLAGMRVSIPPACATCGCRACGPGDSCPCCREDGSDG